MTIGYDYDDQLTSITKPGTTTNYQYDALGRQIVRAVNSVNTNMYYDGGQVLFETQVSGETASYTWGNGLIRRNSEYPLADGRGSERQVTDASQNVTASNVTTAFGCPVSQTGSSASPFVFKGAAGYRAEGDGAAGLAAYTKVGARYYDAAFGRFIMRDTDLTQKPYAYCDGDPVNFSDPSGHDGQSTPNPDGAGDTSPNPTQGLGWPGATGGAGLSVPGGSATSAGGITLSYHPIGGNLTASGDIDGVTVKATSVGIGLPGGPQATTITVGTSVGGGQLGGTFSNTTGSSTINGTFSYQHPIGSPFGIGIRYSIGGEGFSIYGTIFGDSF